MANALACVWSYPELLSGLLLGADRKPSHCGDQIPPFTKNIFSISEKLWYEKQTDTCL